MAEKVWQNIKPKRESNHRNKISIIDPKNMEKEINTKNLMEEDRMYFFLEKYVNEPLKFEKFVESNPMIFSKCCWEINVKTLPYYQKYDIIHKVLIRKLYYAKYVE